MNHFDVIVAGAGPAGLLAAGRAAESGNHVLVLEKMSREGRKLLITGKGRCNITNDADISNFIPFVYPNGRFLRTAFSQFYSKEIINLLHDHGVETTLERGGRYFPTRNEAKDVLDALLQWVNELGVEIRVNHKVEKLLIQDNILRGLIANGQKFTADHVILATGGMSYPATGSDGEAFELARKAGHRDRKSTRLNSSHIPLSRMPSSA